MKKLITITLLLLMTTPCLRAQRKEISQARSYIKSGANLDKAVELMKGLLAKDSTNRHNPKIYTTWFDAVEKQYAAGNEKLYLKQQYDTAALFGYAREMFAIIARLDSVDTSQRKKYSEILNNYRPNLYYGGSFFVRKGQFDHGFDLFDCYIGTASHPMFDRFNYAQRDGRLAEAAYWATYCGYMMKSPERIMKFTDIAEGDSAKLKYTLRYRAEAYLQLNDMENYLITLKRGFEAYPEFRYFFPQLMDYYNERKDYENALQIANEALQTDSTNVLFLFAKSTVLLNMGRSDECIRVSERILHINDTLPLPHYNLGTALLNKAVELEKDIRKNKAQLTAIYREALPYMERFRALAPDQKKMWAPALYRIYLNLNMGKQFEEIDKIINTTNNL